MSEQPRRSRPQDIGVEVVELRVDRSAVATAAMPGENHLGDRLAAFVDGELDHDARERVQSHLATCDACLSRAEEERRVKSRISAAAPPDPSALFLAKLMSIAGDQDEQPPSGPQQPRRGFGGGAFGSGSASGGFGGMNGGLGGWGSNGFGSGRFGSGALGAEHPVPGVDPRAERGMPFQGESRPIAARLRSGFAPSGPAEGPTDRPQGFSGTEDGDGGAVRPAQGRPSGAARPSAARGRRFAFAAAGAFSVAAVALGSAITGVTAAEPTVDEPYGNVAPAAETSGSPAGTVSDYGRANGRAAFGVPVNAPDHSSPYSGPLGAGAPVPGASATALPTTGYAAAGTSAAR